MPANAKSESVVNMADSLIEAVREFDRSVYESESFGRQLALAHEEGRLSELLRAAGYHPHQTVAHKAENCLNRDRLIENAARHLAKSHGWTDTDMMVCVGQPQRCESPPPWVREILIEHEVFANYDEPTGRWYFEPATAQDFAHFAAD